MWASTVHYYILRVGYDLHPVRVRVLNGRALFDWRAWRDILEASFDISSTSFHCDFIDNSMPAPPKLVLATLDEEEEAELVTRRYLQRLVDIYVPADARRRSLYATLARLERHSAMTISSSSQPGTK